MKMLKIKDNVDLSELEKFGFSHIEAMYIPRYRYSSKDVHAIVFYGPNTSENNRVVLENRTDNDFIEIPSVIFDLIKAGLVEKIWKTKWRY